MCKDWTELASKGWEKVEVMKGRCKLTTFKTPAVNGIQRVIRRSSDLKASEKVYASILFPKSSLAKRHISNITTSEAGTSVSCTPDLVTEKPSKIDKEKLLLDQSAARLVPNDRSAIDVSAETKNYAKKLSAIMSEPDENKYDISTITADIICSLADEQNPFKHFPWDTKKNIFHEIIDFGLRTTPFLIKLICNIIRTDSGFEDKSVYKVAFIFSILVCSANPKMNSSFLKLLTLMLKSSGCTGIILFNPTQSNSIFRWPKTTSSILWVSH